MKEEHVILRVINFNFEASFPDSKNSIFKSHFIERLHSQYTTIQIHSVVEIVVGLIEASSVRMVCSKSVREKEEDELVEDEAMNEKEKTNRGNEREEEEEVKQMNGK